MEVSYRTWYKGKPPQPVKLEIPGWAGELTYEVAQPWHCKPFVDASTYGLELVYPFDTETVVRTEGGKLVFECDFTGEKKESGAAWDMPFSKFAEHHFGFTSSVCLKTPDDVGTMVLPHPRFYTDRTGEVPVPAAGFIRTDYWARVFFVVFKSPLEGQRYVFRKNEPYASLVFLPKKKKFKIREMTPGEKKKSEEVEQTINDRRRKIATKTWVTSAGDHFDNKYKVLDQAFSRGGSDEVERVLENSKKTKETKLFRRRIF